MIKKLILEDNASDPISYTDAIAKYILKAQHQCLPDFTHICIFIPNAQAVQQMRESLVSHSQQALLGGHIGSLQEWLKHNIAPADFSKKHLSPAARQLLLLEALNQHADLFQTDNHWQVCDHLLELFDELNLSGHDWLDESTPDWIKKLADAYQTQENIDPLNQEAKIVHVLWHAWQQQLDALNFQDDSGELKQRLLSPIPEHFKNKHFFILGLDDLSPLEQAWCEQLSQHTQVTHISYDGELNLNTKNSSENNTLLQAVYSQTEPLYERTQNYSHRPGFLNNISCFGAHSSEQETRAIDLKIRMSLLSGKTRITVVTENRKLARRLHALLARAEVTVQDTAGWALATTSAATLLERWLQCIEQDFAYQPLLDLLKSPFFCAPENAREHLNLVYRFEQDIVLHENIANNLQRFQNAINNRRERLNLNQASTSEELLSLLKKLDTASLDLVTLFQNNTSTTPEKWIHCFLQSIENLGVYPQLENDIAGQRVQEELLKLSHAVKKAQPEMHWLDLRTWISSTFEREQFKPQSKAGQVKIMNLQQAQYCQFDTLIIAGANMKSFPGSSTQQAFFNQSVRQALQLKNWHQKKHTAFKQFKQLLLSADDILMTWQAEQKGEWMKLSPWVSSLIDFSQQCFNLSLHDKLLETHLQNIDAITQREEHLIKPLKTVKQAFPIISHARIPSEFSASRHQRIIDCPYKFFAADLLQLKPLEKISLELLKSEYGEKVHLILHAFHQQCPDLPPPFIDILSTDNKQKALEHIETLSKQVFNTRMEDSIQHRGWFERWMNTAESYIDWQIQHQKDWKIDQLESVAEYNVNPYIKLTGRLDRVDNNNQSKTIIDYKTGNAAKQADINSGENIQLTSYAALLNQVSRVIYLKLDKGETRISGSLEETELETLKCDILNRLEDIITKILPTAKSPAPLPSWGDINACQYCDMDGLCRKQMWESQAS